MNDLATQMWNIGTVAAANAWIDILFAMTLNYDARLSNCARSGRFTKRYRAHENAQRQTEFNQSQ